VKTFLVGAAVALAVGTGVRADVIDRILAVAEGRIITLSDVTAATRLGLVVVPDGRDPVAAALDHLIDRALILIEVDRYSPPDPDEASVNAGVDAVRTRAAGQTGLDAVLAQVGMTPDLLRRYVRDDLRIQAYLDQRFGTAVQPSQEDILQYYRDHQAEFTRAGALVPFGQASNEAREKLIAVRRKGLIDAWIADLRRRAEVNLVYLTHKG
jgi:hypothetical protein